MPLELRILTGARAGFSASFDKSVIAVGRHATSDLRLDPNADLDVSTRHAEIHEFDGEYTIHDRESTNGTFVNDVRLERGAARVISADEMRRGPTSMPARKIRQRTSQRVAIAVREQTRRLRLLVIGG